MKPSDKSYILQTECNDRMQHWVLQESDQQCFAQSEGRRGSEGRETRRQLAMCSAHSRRGRSPGTDAEVESQSCPSVDWKAGSRPRRNENQSRFEAGSNTVKAIL